MMCNADQNYFLLKTILLFNGCCGILKPILVVVTVSRVHQMQNASRQYENFGASGSKKIYFCFRDTAV